MADTNNQISSPDNQLSSTGPQDSPNVLKTVACNFTKISNNVIPSTIKGIIWDQSATHSEWEMNPNGTTYTVNRTGKAVWNEQNWNVLFQYQKETGLVSWQLTTIRLAGSEEANKNHYVLYDVGEELIAGSGKTVVFTNPRHFIKSGGGLSKLTTVADLKVIC
jgi:hypothetical protein